MRAPKTRMPRAPGAPGAASVVNTGVRQSNTVTTGATGNVTNTVRSSSVQGAPGAPGRISQPATAAVGPVFHGDASAAVAAATARSNEIRASAMQSRGEAIDGAFTQAEGALAQARARTLAETPSAYRDQIGVHFDTASANLADMHRRMRGD